MEKGGLPYNILKQTPKIDVVTVGCISGGFSKLSNREIDALIVDRCVGLYILAEHGFKGIMLTGVSLVKNNSAIAVRKGETALLAKINHVLKEIRNDGTYSRILEKWNPKEVVFQSKEQALRIRIIMFGVFGALVISVLIVLKSFTEALNGLKKQERRKNTDFNPMN